MWATPLDIYEELRFVWELYAAETILLAPFAEHKGGFLRRALLGAALFSAVSQLYFPLVEVTKPLGISQPVVAVWYVLLALGIMVYQRVCYRVSLADALYVGVVSYAAQHLIYIVVHEYLVLAAWPQLATMLALYATVSALACAVLYLVLYAIFSLCLSAAGGRLIYDRPRGSVDMAVLLAMLLVLSFQCQHLFRLGGECEGLAVAIGTLVCLLVLGIQYANIQAVLANRERAAVEQIMREGEKNSALTQDLIEYVNRSVHDLKHALRALETLPQAERSSFIAETERNIAAYQSMVWSDNESLNTILSEKALSCERQGIQFSCFVGKVDVDFIAIPDLYVLLGNVVDNAIEGVSKVPEGERAVSLSLRQERGALCISCDNPYAGELKLRDGLPLTSKADRARHGFGLKSVQHLVEKYGGTLVLDAEGGVFSLQAVFPAR